MGCHFGCLEHYLKVANVNDYEDQAFPEELGCAGSMQSSFQSWQQLQLEQWVHTTIYKIGTQQGPTL